MCHCSCYCIYKYSYVHKEVKKSSLKQTNRCLHVRKIMVSEWQLACSNLGKNAQITMTAYLVSTLSLNKTFIFLTTGN